MSLNVFKVSYITEIKDCEIIWADKVASTKKEKESTCAFLLYTQKAGTGKSNACGKQK